MRSELHLLIIWEKSRHKAEVVIDELKKKFTVREVYEIWWPQTKFACNLKRFYGVTLSNPQKKEIQCGNGPFLVILISDQNSKYEKRNTSLGEQNVNVNVYDLKRKFRTMIEGEYPIHGSIHEKEANHDLVLLFGKNVKQMENIMSKEWDGKVKKFRDDLHGSNGWNSLEDVFNVLNSTSNYVVLRNFEELPKKIPDREHNDIDILMDERWHVPFLLNVTKPKNGGSPHVNVGNEKILVDIHYVGDSYYDEKWSKNILKNRIKSRYGIFIPNEEDQFYSLLYHCLIHGAGLSKDYLKRLEFLSKNLGIKIENYSDTLELKKLLNQFMEKSNYPYTNSVKYKLKHSEILRLINVAIFIAKHEGMNKVFYAMKGKIRRIIKPPK